MDLGLSKRKRKNSETCCDPVFIKKKVEQKKMNYLLLDLFAK